MPRTFPQMVRTYAKTRRKTNNPSHVLKPKNDEHWKILEFSPVLDGEWNRGTPPVCEYHQSRVSTFHRTLNNHTGTYQQVPHATTVKYNRYELLFLTFSVQRIINNCNNNTHYLSLNTQDNTHAGTNFRPDFLPKRWSTLTENGGLGKISTRPSIDVSLGVCTLPDVEKTSLEIRPRVYVSFRVIRHKLRNRR